MRRYLVSAFFLLVSVAALANLSVEHPSGLALSHPEDWKVRLQGQTLVLRAPQPSQGVVILAAVPLEKEDEVTPRAASRKVEALMQDLVAEPFVLDQQPVEVHDLPGQLVSGQGRLTSGGEEARWLALFVSYNKKIYCVRGAASATEWDWDRALVSLIVNSVRAGV